MYANKPSVKKMRKNRANIIKSPKIIAKSKERINDNNANAGNTDLNNVRDYLNESTSLIDEEGFEKVESKMQRRRRLRESLQVSQELQGARPPSCYIFLYHIQRGDPRSVTDYLNKRNLKVEKIEVVSHPGAKFKSFKICVPKTSLNKLMSEDFWPDGAYCRLWKDKEYIKHGRNFDTDGKKHEYYNSRYNSYSVNNRFES